MAITFEAVSYGSVFEISVWRYSTEPCGVIVASATKSEIFYNAESTELEKDANGWQYLKKTIFIPTQLPGNSLTIYLWNNGKFPVYFDDLKIIRK